MARSFSRPARPARGTRRLTDWGSIGPFTDAVTGTGTNLVATLNAAGLALRPFTIVRTHLAWSVTSDQTAATEDQQIAVGMAVVSEQAAAAGVGSVPTPITDLGSDLWFLWDYIAASFLFISGVGFSPELAHTRYVDSKAMRKVNADQDLAIVLEAPSSSDGMGIHMIGRFLVKLH